MQHHTGLGFGQSVVCVWAEDSTLWLVCEDSTLWLVCAFYRNVPRIGVLLGVSRYLSLVFEILSFSATWAIRLLHGLLGYYMGY